ncbi:AAA family ATPase [Curvibacter fontanus]
MVLLVDQLDALSELIDLRTDRLTIILRLVREVKDIENVHIVSSCRTFDRNYDARLSAIDAEEIQLELPSWVTIEILLKEKGIDSAAWPEGFREILRTPQCLKFFLQHFSRGDELGIFESYQTMLERVWTERLFGLSAIHGASELLHDIATEMAEREVMFVASARYDSHRAALDYVVGAGILQFDHTGRQISFTHQTLFDFSRARAFIAKEQSLSRYVLERQTGLFVRPKLWSALHYLRGSDSNSYRTELSTIWRAEGLRAHIRMLLIEFVGQQEPPLDFEIQLLRPVFLDPIFGPNAFSAVAGHNTWFDAIHRDIIPAAMESSAQLSWSTVRVLTSAWSFAENRILELIKAHWQSDDQKRFNAWNVLRGLEKWKRNSVDLAISIIDSLDLQTFLVRDLAATVSMEQPDLAPEILAAHLKKQMHAAFTERNKHRAAEAGHTLESPISEQTPKDFQDPLKRILESTTDWHEVAAIAEAGPGAYLEFLWPPIREAIETIACENQSKQVAYQADYLLATNLEIDNERQGYEYALMDSFAYAVRCLAKQSPAKFQEFLDQNKTSESMTVHRLLALGLCEIAESSPNTVLTYLTDDPRRLSLENYHEDERETKILLRALVPHLDAEGSHRLERYILGARIYKETAKEEDLETRRLFSNYERQFRLRLLLQFPSSQLSQETNQLIASELRIFKSFKDERREIEMISSQSAMSSSEMEQADARTLQNFLAAFPDSTEWGDPFKEYGGSIEVSREFSQFAKKNPARAIAVIYTLDPATQQRPAAYAIRELEEDQLSSQALIDLVVALDAKGFSGQEFRESAAAAFRKRVKSNIGIPDAGIDLLSKWLATFEFSNDDVQNEVSEDRTTRDERKESFLWGYGGAYVLPHGSYPILDALFFGLIARTPTPSGRIISLLNQHLDRGDSLRVWDAMAGGALSRLTHCNHEAAQNFLHRLFEAHDSLLIRRNGVHLVAHSLRWASRDLTRSWIKKIGDIGTPLALQIYAELLVLRAVLLIDDDWSRSEIDQILADAEHDPIKNSSKARGLMYAAAHLWIDAKDRALLVTILCVGMDSTDSDTATAAIDWFRVSGELSHDAITRSILDAFADGRSLDFTRSRSHIVDSVSDLIDQAPDLVYKIAKRLLDIYKEDVGNLSTGSALDAESLVRVALTLQRQDEPHRTNGLDLFEQLLHYNAYRARDVLMDIDRRPGTSIQPTKLRRRRRNKARTAT